MLEKNFSKKDIKEFEKKHKWTKTYFAIPEELLPHIEDDLKWAESIKRICGLAKDKIIIKIGFYQSKKIKISFYEYKEEKKFYSIIEKVKSDAYEVKVIFEYE